MLKAYGSYGLYGLILPIFYYYLFFLLQLIAELNHVTHIILLINSYFSIPTSLQPGHISNFHSKKPTAISPYLRQIILLTLREYSILLNL